MHMWYWFGADLGTFLFPGYNVTTTWGLVATCLGLGALAIVYESMRVLQMKLQQFTMASVENKFTGSTENSSLLSKFSPLSLRSSSSTYCVSWSRWFIEVFHWSIHTTLGYILMMAVMTYNGYISIVLALGGCLGYWIFGTTLIELNMAQFNRRKSIQCDPDCSDVIINAERRQSIVSVVAEQLITEANVDVHA